MTALRSNAYGRFSTRASRHRPERRTRRERVAPATHDPARDGRGRRADPADRRRPARDRRGTERSAGSRHAARGDRFGRVVGAPGPRTPWRLARDPRRRFGQRLLREAARGVRRERPGRAPGRGAPAAGCGPGRHRRVLRRWSGRDGAGDAGPRPRAGAGAGRYVTGPGLVSRRAARPAQPHRADRRGDPRRPARCGREAGMCAGVRARLRGALVGARRRPRDDALLLCEAAQSPTRLSTREAAVPPAGRGPHSAAGPVRQRRPDRGPAGRCGVG
jgi:hypothetical protein